MKTDNGALPSEVLARSTVVCIGTGGARSWLEDLARAGVGRFVLLDGDRVEARNLATQGVFADEVGQYKVYCVRSAILRIRPRTQVTAIPRFLDDEMDDADFQRIVGPELYDRPECILIAGCTDHFDAQARSARLALQFGTPYLAAQLYCGGLAGEVYFSYPGLTTGGCPRCAMASRYQAYLEQSYENDVTSQGTSIFATQRLNALKGQLSLMLLLARAEGTPYAHLLEQVSGRNFVLVRMHPGAGATLGMPILVPSSPTAFCDEAIWIPQHPNHPKYGEPLCPLCGGEADLSAMKGTIPDTRIHR